MPGEERSESATAKKRRDERKKGNVLMSKDITTLLALVASFVLIQALFPYITEGIMLIFQEMFGKIAIIDKLDGSELIDIVISLAIAFLALAGPVLAVSMLVTILVTFMQTKMMFATELLKPKFDKLNPLKGIKNLFALKNIVELVKGLIKVTIILVIIYINIKDGFLMFTGIWELGIINAVKYMADKLMSMFFSIVIAFLGITILDFLYQRWQYEKDLKMTKEEVKQEHKQTEGDPKIKAKIKEKQREMASRRMMQEVPTADVVIKNPTHYAVAIRYKSGENVAPVVIAKGSDRIALKIIAIAEENDVEVIENKPLARGLYDAVEVNQIIPEEFYQVIAEILAWVYKAKKVKNP